jgi:hypothetical protein
MIPAMSDQTPRQRATETAIYQSTVVPWLRANVVAIVVLIISVLSSCGLGLWAASRWVSASEGMAAQNGRDVLAAAVAIQVLKNDIIDIDRRLNAEQARIAELHALSDAADQQLKSRLDIIDALGKATAERAYQPPLPTPRSRP